MTEPSLRERKKLATRRELALASLDLTLERGLAETTVEEITERVGFSRRTFANHFTCKQEAVVAGFFLRLGLPGSRFEPFEVELGDPLTVDAVVDAAEAAYRAVFSGEGAVRVAEMGRVVDAEPTLAPFVHQTLFEVRREYRARLVAAGMPPARAALLLGALLCVGGVVVEELIAGHTAPDDVAALLAEGLDHVRHGFADRAP